MSMDIDGIDVHEENRQHGAAWRWDSTGPHPIQYEIEWVQGKDMFLYSTRVPPGGWNVSTLDPGVWIGDGTYEGARDMVLRGLPTLPR